MLFWIIYFIVSLFISYRLSLLFSTRLRKYLLLSIFIVLITPASIDSGSTKLAPALSVFIFDLLLEGNFSLRSLRPILLSLPTSLLILIISLKVKKRFF